MMKLFDAIKKLDVNNLEYIGEIQMALKWINDREPESNYCHINL